MVLTFDVQGGSDLGVAVPGGRQLAMRRSAGVRALLSPGASRARPRAPASGRRRGYGMRTSDGDGDLSLCAAAFQVAYGLGHFGERIGLAHDGGEVTGLDLLAQCFEVSLALVSAGDVHGQPLG